MIKLIDTNLKNNENTVKQLFNSDKNIDFNFREFKVEFKNETADAFLIYYDGMSNQTFLNRDICGLCSHAKRMTQA